MRNRFIAALGVLAALCSITLAGTAPAVAKTTTAKATALAGSDFALVCDVNPSYRARTDLNDVTITQVGGRVDSDAIRFRALNHSNGAVSIRFEEVRIELYDGVAGAWVTWTSRGGTSTDGVTIAPDFTWNPDAKNNLNASYNAIRMKAWYNGSTCTSPARTT